MMLKSAENYMNRPSQNKVGSLRLKTFPSMCLLRVTLRESSTNA